MHTATAAAPVVDPDYQVLPALTGAPYSGTTEGRCFLNLL